MARVAESKKHRRIDWRPKVFIRVMRLELAFFFLFCVMVTAMPWYFWKGQYIIEEYEARRQAKVKLDLKREALEREKMVRESLKEQKAMGRVLTTAEKGKLMTDVELAEKIKQLEKEV